MGLIFVYLLAICLVFGWREIFLLLGWLVSVCIMGSREYVKLAQISTK